MDEQAVHRFHINVPGRVLDDLWARLAVTRWPEPEPVDDWSQEVPSAYLRSLCRFWQHQYDWRATERMLNDLDQLTTSINPQTIGYALTDSPVGQVAWIVEKYQAWIDCDGHPEQAIGRNKLLDTVTLYWITATAASSARLYWSRPGPHCRGAIGPHGPPRLDHPSGEVWVEQTFTDLRHRSERQRGGHFAPLEVPEVFVDELRTAAANLGLR
jgi:hypothetical protein